MAQWTPLAEFEGFRSVIHGGIVSTLLDEAMAKAVAASGTFGFTAEMRVRFRQHVTTGEPVTIRG